MNRMISVVATIVAALSIAACTAAPPPTPTAEPTPTVVVAPTSTAAAAPSSNSAAATAGTRITGTVQTLSGSSVTLGDGTTFTISPDTRLLHSVDEAVSDLQTGDLVAVTAKKQDDGTLLASIVNVFPKSLQNIRQGQSPMDAGNLMTNATVDTVANGGFTVKYPDGTALVKLAPDAKVTKLTDGTLADIKVGSSLLGLVVNGVARSVTIR
jgi:hypothetical protein